MKSLFSNKKGYIKPMGKGMNFFIAIIVLAGGVVPLLEKLKIIGELPVIPDIVFPILLIIAGLVLLLDAMLGVSSSGI